MKNFAIGCLFLVAFSTQAQYEIRVDQAAAGTLFRNKVTDIKPERITGSPYLQEEFVSSVISGAENPFLTRYNAYKDQVEINYNNETFVMPKDDRYITVTNRAANTTFQLVKYTSAKNDDVYGYLTELYSNEKTAIFRRDKIIVIKGREAVDTYSRGTDPKYAPARPEFYIKVDNARIISFPEKKKDLLALYPNKEDLISKFLKDRKISLKKESDLIELTKFLGTL